jgi:TonB family protein
MSSISVFALTTTLLLASLTQAGTLQHQLESDYVGKVLTLRHFYQGDHLKFRADGTLDGNTAVGPWTVDGQLSVEKIDLRSHTLYIQGRRIYLVYDSKSRQFHDDLIALKDYAGKDRGDLEKFLRNSKVEIEIALPSKKPNDKELSAAMRKVFLAPGESMIDAVPSFWRTFFEKQEKRAHEGPNPREGVFYVTPGSGVSAPKPTSTPDPDYSEPARKLKWQGTSLVSLIVDVAGAATELQITAPLGLGLDEKAVDAVSNWKFEPAMKDGKPVPVEIAVEVQFRLY